MSVFAVLELEDKIVDQGAQFRHLITSKHVRDSTTRSATGDSMASSGTASPAEQRDLVRVRYTRSVPSRPFMTKSRASDQTVNVELSTINVMLTRVSVLAVYDWIMTTFVSVDEPASSSSSSSQEHQQRRPSRSSGSTTERRNIDEAVHPTFRVETPTWPTLANGADAARKEKLRVRVKLNSIVLRLNNDGSLLATLTLSTADVAVMLRGNTIRVAARLGSLLLYDNAAQRRRPALQEAPQHSRRRAGPISPTRRSMKQTRRRIPATTFHLAAVGLAQVHLCGGADPRPAAVLQQVAQMKAVYDAATLAASNKASQLQERVDKMHYDILVKTPIVVLRGPPIRRMS